MMTCREFINGKNRKFDISWFIPAVVKYRKLFGEVILASFFLQLFALVSPLLFQVVIDKVLVNRGLSSLDVLMVALICIVFFETLLGGLRTYTFSHTTTRVDIDEYLIKMHTRLLKSQMAEKAAKIEVLNGQIAKAEKEKDTIQADLTRIEKLSPSVEERIEKKKILVDKKLLARLTFLEQEEELTNLQEQRNVQVKKMAETEENIEYLKKELRQYLAEFDKNIMQELTESREKLASYQQELIKYQEALKRTIVKAPLSGYVQQLVYHTKGGVVETAKPIMNLVPEDYKLEADVMILNKDIGFVRPDQDVEIKIDSFPFTKYGTIKGKVRNISGDAVQDEKLGLIFPSRLTLLDNKIKADGQIVQLKPGMSVTAEIKTGKRRVIEYLLSPVMKYLNEGMRER